MSTTGVATHEITSQAEIPATTPQLHSRPTATPAHEIDADEKHVVSDRASSVSVDPKIRKDIEAGHGMDDAIVEGDKEHHRSEYARYRPFILGAFALLVLAWWICSITLKATRHRWIVQTFFSWAILLIIAFRFLPNSIVTRPVGAVWEPLVSRPFFRTPYYVRLGAGWLALIGIVFGSAFGFSLPVGSSYGDRAISVFGLLVFQTFFWIISKSRTQVPWPTVIVGLFFQQAIALFVLKSDAGLKIFKWIATLASDFLNEAATAAGFFFDPETIAKHWFFVNTLAAIIFFIAFVQMLYYLGTMQWIIGKFAWFFFKTMNVSGAEAVVAAASPFIGQGESACLVRPYVDIMTPSELHLTMTSGFSTISGSVLAAYINLGIPASTLITSSVMSIPASIAISKVRYPETEEPVTRAAVVVDRGVEGKNAPANALHAFSQGATFGIIVAGQILTNVLTVLALVYTIDGLLTWIGKGFGIHQLTLELILGYVFYPLTFLMGVPRDELLGVSRLLGLKFVANEFVAYSRLVAIQADAATALSQRSFIIATYSLCGFANLGSLGIQIGVLSILAPSRAKIITKIAPSALICGFLSTMQTAGIAGMLV